MLTRKIFVFVILAQSHLLTFHDFERWWEGWSTSIFVFFFLSLYFIFVEIILKPRRISKFGYVVIIFLADHTKSATETDYLGDLRRLYRCFFILCFIFTFCACD